MYVISGPTGALGTTPAFKCNATICYSADGAGVGKGTDALLRQLQTLLNAFSSKTGIAVAADGKIGSGTVSSANAVAAYILRAAPEDIAVANVLKVNAASKEILTQTAQSSIDLLVREASKLGVMPNTGVVVTVPVNVPATQTTFPTTVPTPGGSPSGTFPTPAASVATSIEAIKAKWPYYLGGAAVAGGLIYLIWTLSDEPKKPALQGARSRKRRKTKTGFDRRYAYGR